MPGIKKRREYFTTTAGNNYSIEDSDNIQQDIPVSFCQRCLDLGFNNPLKERLYRKDELVNGKKPSDWELWAQCHTCGEIVAVLHAKQENEIVPHKELPDSIYDIKKLSIEHFVPSRRNDINRKIKKPIRENPETDDLDVKPKIERGSKLISYDVSDR